MYIYIYKLVRLNILGLIVVASIIVLAMVFCSVVAELVMLFNAVDVSNDVVVISPRSKLWLYSFIQ